MVIELHSHWHQFKIINLQHPLIPNHCQGHNNMQWKKRDKKRYIVSGYPSLVHIVKFSFFSSCVNGWTSALTMSVGELIELRDLVQDQDRIELTSSYAPCYPPRLERTNALRISAGKVPELLSRVGIIRVLSSHSDPQPAEERGEGHNFQPCSHTQPTWCDLCGDFIWGLYKQSLRCISEFNHINSSKDHLIEYFMSNFSGSQSFLSQHLVQTAASVCKPHRSCFSFINSLLCFPQSAAQCILFFLYELVKNCINLTSAMCILKLTWTSIILTKSLLFMFSWCI